MLRNPTNYVISQLDLNAKSRKGWFGYNLSGALGRQSNRLPQDWADWIDSTIPEVGSVAVIPRGSTFFQSGTDIFQIGFVGVVDDIVENNVHITDTKIDYSVSKQAVLGYITPKRLREVGFPIKVREQRSEPDKRSPGFFETRWNAYKDKNGLEDPFGIETDRRFGGDIVYYINMVAKKVAEDIIEKQKQEWAQKKSSKSS